MGCDGQCCRALSLPIVTVFSRTACALNSMQLSERMRSRIPAEDKKMRQPHHHAIAQETALEVDRQEPPVGRGAIDSARAVHGRDVLWGQDAMQVGRLRNGRRANGELKQASGLTSATPLDSVVVAQARLDAARTWLDEERPRAVLGGVTAAARDASLQPGYPLVDRGVIYTAARVAIATAVQDMPAGRARRMAEREAIWCTLERFGLIERTRRRGAPGAVKSERDL